MEEIRILELFAGIGACSKAFEKLNIPHKIVDAVEIDKYAIASFNAVHGTNFPPQDITKWDKDVDVDFILHGSPCQDFSLAGLQRGGDEGTGTRSSLMYESLRIIKKLKPKYVVWENVKNLISDKHVHNFEKYLNAMELLGYENNYKVMNAKDYGIPQNRERVFTVSIRKDLNKHFVFPLEKPLTLKLKDMLEDQVDEKYYLSDKALHGVLNTTFYQSSLEGRTETKDGCIPTLAARDYKDPKLVVEDTLRIKNATEKGYLEAAEGDGIDISGRMKFHRGNVQKDMIQTITTDGGNSRGVVVGDKVNVVGNYSPSGHNAARIVDSDGIAPTVMENHGTVTATVVPDNFSGAEVLKSVRTDYGKEVRKDYEDGNIDLSWADMRKLEPRDDGISNTLSTVQKDNYVLVDDKYYLSDKGVKFVLDPKRGMCTDVNADVAQTLTAKGQQNWTGSFVSPDIDYIEKNSTIGGTEPTVIHLKSGETITSDDL